jgi:hypothetical protein
MNRSAKICEPAEIKRFHGIWRERKAKQICRSTDVLEFEL